MSTTPKTFAETRPTVRFPRELELLRLQRALSTENLVLKRDQNGQWYVVDLLRQEKPIKPVHCTLMSDVTYRAELFMDDRVEIVYGTPVEIVAYMAASCIGCPPGMTNAAFMNSLDMRFANEIEYLSYLRETGRSKFEPVRFAWNQA